MYLLLKITVYNIECAMVLVQKKLNLSLCGSIGQNLKKCVNLASSFVSFIHKFEPSWSFGNVILSFFFGVLSFVFSSFTLFSHYHISFPTQFVAEDCDEESKNDNARQWVALAVVQSYNPRCKVPRNSISISDLDCCLSKASFSAAQNAGTIQTINPF